MQCYLMDFSVFSTKPRNGKVYVWKDPTLHMCIMHSVLSAKFITGGYGGIDRRPCINSEGGHSAPEAIEFKMKLAGFKMAVSLEPFDRF